MDKEQAQKVLWLGRYVIDKTYLPLVKAMAEGKSIQLYNTVSSRWEDDTNWDFSCEISRYRIKPQDEKVKITCEGKTVEISRESAKALNLI